MNIVLLGAPGAGKGTQGAMISKHFGIPTISTGNIIRDALKSGSEMGLKVKSYVDKGQLVPDEIVIGIVKDRIKQSDCENGFILDGFPRTLAQAEALDKSGVNIDKVVDIEVADELIYKRMSGRRICSKCGQTYNVELGMNPKTEGICDDCRGDLIQRADDKLETVKARLKVYYDQTHVLKSYYDKQNKRLVIDGSKSPQEIIDYIVNNLEA